MEFIESWKTKSIKQRKLFTEEYLIALVTEEIYDAMDKDGSISKKDLATALGRSKAYVSQLLSGSRNMTLRTLADISVALGRVPEFRFRKEEAGSQWQTIPGSRVARFRYSAQLNYQCENDGIELPSSELAAA